MKTKRDRGATLAAVLSHVSIIYAPALRIGARAGMAKREAAWYLGLLVHQCKIERRVAGQHFEYRLNLKRRARA